MKEFVLQSNNINDDLEIQKIKFMIIENAERIIKDNGIQNDLFYEEMILYCWNHLQDLRGTHSEFDNVLIHNILSKNRIETPSKDIKQYAGIDEYHFHETEIF